MIPIKLKPADSALKLKVMLQIRLFGALQVQINGRWQALRGAGGQLVAYLALFPQQHARADVAMALWPDTTEEQARRNLATTLYRLRQDSAEIDPHLQITHDTIELTNCDTDLAAFRNLLAMGELDCLEQALALYQDDLLINIDSHWHLPQRALLRQQMLTALNNTIDRHESAHNLTAALQSAERFMQAEPLDETAVARAMRLHAKRGNHAAALKCFAQLRQQLDRELGLPPLPATQQLAQRIRHEREYAQRDQVALRQFIGRNQPRNLLLNQLAKLADNQGSISWITGAAGIGKSWLLENIADAARWRQLSVAEAVARPDGTQQAFAPLADALQQAVTPAIESDLRQTLPAIALPVAAQLLPALLPQQQPDLSVDAFQNGQLQASVPAVASVVASIVQTMVQHGPVVLLFDDVQWAEASFWSLLPHLLRLTKRHPLALMLAHRPVEDASVLASLQRMDQQNDSLRIELTGFDIAETVALAQALDRRVDSAEINRIHHQSNGHPLLLTELLSQQTVSAASLDQLFLQRLAALTLAERQAINMLAVGGGELAYDVWATALDDAPPTSKLQRARFVAITSTGYRLQHDLLRGYLLTQLNAVALRQLHADLAQTLTLHRAQPPIIAWHAEQGHQWALAVSQHRRAAKRAIITLAYEVAADHCTRAETALAQAGLGDDARMLEQQRIDLLRVHLASQTEPLGDWHRQLPDAIMLHAQDAPFDLLFDSVQLHLVACVVTGDEAAVSSLTQIGLALVENGDPADELRMLRSILFARANLLNDLAETVPLMARALRDRKSVV